MSQLVKMKFDMVLKQFRLNILGTLKGVTFPYSWDVTASLLIENKLACI